MSRVLFHNGFLVQKVKCPSLPNSKNNIVNSSLICILLDSFVFTVLDFFIDSVLVGFVKIIHLCNIYIKNNFTFRDLILNRDCNKILLLVYAVVLYIYRSGKYYETIGSENLLSF